MDHIKENKNICVQDGPLILSSSGFNPYMFITGLAERNMAAILKEYFG